ncbi:MAG TPA: hypothetical protein VKT82_33185 [Ktedonobacterales bacterium]|nr:hypothetical protein [Ktedonobacterales bacterium]
MGEHRSRQGRRKGQDAPAVTVPAGLKIVLAGIDTLWLSVKGTLDEGMAAELDRLKELAQQVKESVPSSWSFAGQTLYVEPYGAGKGFWRWVLRCDYLMLDVGLGEYAPMCRAQVASEYLWQVGATDAVSSVDHFLRVLFGEHVHISPSDVHVCVDVAGLTPGMLSEVGLVGRSRRRVKEMPEEGEEKTALPSGEVQQWCRKATGYALSRGAPHSCTIYDKVLEIKQKSGKIWFFDLWQANGWDGQAPVCRLEFRYKREFLRAFGLVDGEELNHYDLLDRLGDLWCYSTTEWLRYCIPTSDVNRSRWPVHPLWQVIQAADFGALPSCLLVRVRKRQFYLDRAVATVAGYLSSSAAWLGGRFADDQVDISVVLGWFCERAEQYYAEREQAFSSIVRDKRQRFGLVRPKQTAA